MPESEGFTMGNDGRHVLLDVCRHFGLHSDVTNTHGFLIPNVY